MRTLEVDRQVSAHAPCPAAAHVPLLTPHYMFSPGPQRIPPAPQRIPPAPEARALQEAQSFWGIPSLCQSFTDLPPSSVSSDSSHSMVLASSEVGAAHGTTSSNHSSRPPSAASFLHLPFTSAQASSSRTRAQSCTLGSLSSFQSAAQIYSQRLSRAGSSRAGTPLRAAPVLVYIPPLYI